MARPVDRERAIRLRLRGFSYSQIKDTIGVSKSTLHYWLKEYPLSDERIRELRDWNAQRIERFRKTMEKKRLARQDGVFQRINRRIGKISAREFLISGFFLYWAEGPKTTHYTVALTNTDPAMLRFFIKWLSLLGGKEVVKKLRARLHLYTDMDTETQTRFWMNELGLPRAAFRNPYIKTVDSQKRKNYKGRFGYGTCCVWIAGRDIYDVVLMGLRTVRLPHE